MGSGRQSIKTILLALSLAGAPVVIDLTAGAMTPGLREASAMAQDKKSAKRNSGGLAGSEGNVKRKVLFEISTEGGCQAHWRRYVAAGGHSAYASTQIDYFYGGFFACGISINASSAAEAERRAVEDCKLAVKQTKARNQSASFSGACSVNASK